MRARHMQLTSPPLAPPVRRHAHRTIRTFYDNSVRSQGWPGRRDAVMSAHAANVLSAHAEHTSSKSHDRCPMESSWPAHH